MDKIKKGADAFAPRRTRALNPGGTYADLFTGNGRTMSAEYLYEKVWGQAMTDDVNVVKYHISNLRKKLSGSGYSISATRGEGYCFYEATSRS